MPFEPEDEDEEARPDVAAGAQTRIFSWSRGSIEGVSGMAGSSCDVVREGGCDPDRPLAKLDFLGGCD